MNNGWSQGVSPVNIQPLMRLNHVVSNDGTTKNGMGETGNF